MAIMIPSHISYNMKYSSEVFRDKFEKNALQVSSKKDFRANTVVEQMMELRRIGENRLLSLS